MKTLHATLTVVFLAVSIFISGPNFDLVGAQNTAAGPEVSRPLSDPLRSRYFRFGRITTRDGLSNDQIRQVFQDKRGFMWFGTFDGLNRYDGAGIKVYRTDQDDPNSLSNNIVRAMVADQSGDLWIGTWGGGLNLYDLEKDAFIRYQHNPDYPNSLILDLIWSAVEVWTGVFFRSDRESVDGDDRFLLLTRYGGNDERGYSPSQKFQTAPAEFGRL